MPHPTDGARAAAGAVIVGGVGPRAGRRAAAGRPISAWAFAGVAVASFGGPLAIAALDAPSLAAGVGTSAGLATLAAAVVFAAPLTIWVRYARHIAGAGGLCAFVEDAAGRRVALGQAALWILSYLLYLIYTTLQIVYDLLPQVLPGERRYQTLLALLIPVAIAAVMVAGRPVALLVLCLVAAGQVALAGILDGVTLAHVSPAASGFGAGAPAGSLAKAAAQGSLLYICGSLPVFLGGELEAPARTIRRGLIGAWLLTATVVVLAVAPLAAAPGLLRTDVPGVRVVQLFAGGELGDAVAIGVAASTAGLILSEYLALTRLLHAITTWGVRRITVGIGIVIVIAAPITLLDPRGLYGALLKPSLVALWLSQLIVFAVYPRFASRRHQRALPAWALSLVAGGLALYGVWTALQSASG